MATNENTHSVSLIWIEVALLVMLSAGCSSATNGATVEEVTTSAGESFIVHMADGRPHEVVMNGGQRVRFVDGEAIVGNHLLLATTNGTVEAYRTPRAIMSDVDRLPTPYLVEDTFEFVVLDGDQGSHATDPATGRVVLRAITCENPACAGEGTDEHPFLFDTHGESASLKGSSEVQKTRHVVPALQCPACQLSKYVVPYELPDSARRKAELLEEVARTRAARDN